MNKDEVSFVEIAETAGLDFVHFNGASGNYYFCEIIGSGGALFDYDNDGDLDVYLVQGHMLGDKPPSHALFPYSGDSPPRDRLFRNDLSRTPGGEVVMKFVDVTDESGIRAFGYGMGAATGDIDNDGWVDLYVTQFGSNLLFKNNGDGTFSDITAAAGADDPRWSVSAALVDINRDGWLDLMIGNYTDFTLENHVVCADGEPDYCHPRQYAPVPDKLLLNRGHGRFEDISETAGITAGFGRALGVVACDVNGDGWLDLYVANDASANQLWVNQQDGTFLDMAVLTGCAFNETGLPEGSMGVDAADFDGDGDEDLFMTHLRSETNTLYVNQGDGLFADHTVLTGLGLSSLAYTGFGTAWVDYDNDGWLDLFIANGAVTKLQSVQASNHPFPFAQKNQLFRNTAGQGFEEITHAAGPALDLVEVSRGASFGDVDNDGDIDILVTNNSGRVRLLRNEVGNRNHWIGLRLRGASAKRDMLGARVGLYRRGLPPLWRRVRTDASYASANDPRVLIGLGVQTDYEKIVVIWPNGVTEQWTDLAPDQWHTLVSGSGQERP